MTETSMWTEDWPPTYEEARRLQALLRSQVRLAPLPHPPRLLAGVDVSYSKAERKIFGSIVIMNFPEMTVVETAGMTGEERFPYIPGLLSFREAPILLEALAKIQHRPELILVDGQGIAHPRGLGLASHLGLLSGIPTIGCAKSRLWGDFDTLGDQAGSCRPLSWHGQQLGWVLRSKNNCRPLFISPGHLVTMAESLTIVRLCLRKYRLPLPLREAHLLSNTIRRQDISPPSRRHR
ncbi:MAG TPA: deoxyribonuclease V [Desulfobacterales bacterium]|nr:deoxyribonuclease V [Desulfobacterales bacterium]